MLTSKDYPFIRDTTFKIIGNKSSTSRSIIATELNYLSKTFSKDLYSVIDEFNEYDDYDWFITYKDFENRYIK